MKEDSSLKIYENKVGQVNILNHTRKTLNESESIANKNIQLSKIKLEKPNTQRITLYKISKTPEKKNIYKNNTKYNLIIKKIAKKLKKRKKFPKCKIFKFYISYRILILRIAKGIKQTAKRFNFWEKWEKNNINNIKNITEQEINQIQEIASTACKFLEEENKKIGGRKKKISSSDKKNKKNIKIGLSLFKKDDEKEEKLKNQNMNINNKKTEIEKNIYFLKNLNPKENINVFINNFTKFLEKNDIAIIPETKLPNFINNKNNYLLKHIEFWIKYIHFISIKYKNALSIYNYINFIELFYIWNNNNKIFEEFNTEIKNLIKIAFSKDTINDFFKINKINSLDELFERYKNIYINYKYKEVKIKENECQCSFCVNNGLINKIINYNKKNNEISKENNIFYISKNENKKEKNINKGKYNNKNNLYVENLDEVKNNKNANKNTDKSIDIDIFEYLQKIEKRKNIEEKKEKEKKNRNSSKKKRNKSNKNKFNKNRKIQEIFDLLSIDGDLDNLDNNKNENSSTKAPKRNKSKKIRKRYYP